MAATCAAAACAAMASPAASRCWATANSLLSVYTSARRTQLRTSSSRGKPAGKDARETLYTEHVRSMPGGNWRLYLTIDHGSRHGKCMCMVVA